jgi:uncharacterized protein YdbL (DUF1318 family)
MADRIQTYKNHARFFPPFHFFVVPVLALNALNEIRHVIQDPNIHTLKTLVVALALVTLAVSARVMALTVQDRVIRLEMRQRLGVCLPADLQARIGDLTRQQLVALRFASDAELADLVRDVLAGKLASTKEIKLRVKNWQSDWLRA